MNNFTICISETVMRLVQIGADSEVEALDQAEALYESVLWEEMRDEAPYVHYDVLASSTKKNHTLGRPRTVKEDIPPVFHKNLPAYLSGQIPLTEFAKRCNLSRPSIYKYLRILKEENK